MSSKGLRKFTVPVLLAAVVAVSLWFASPQFAGPAVPVYGYAYGGGGGGFGGGGGGGAPALPGVTNLSIYTNDEGKFNIAATAKSADGKVSLSIDQGVVGKTKDGSPLKYVGIAPMEDPPEPPADTSVIGVTYEFTPAGATFTPAVTLSFTYDPAKLPAGVSESKLVIAWYDSAAGKWVELAGTVDTATHSITVKITHFTAFAVIAHTRPASITIGDMNVSASEVTVGGSVTVSAKLSNGGDLSGTYKCTLRLDGTTVATADVTVAGGGSSAVSLSAVVDKEGTHTLDLNGLTGKVVAKLAALPAQFRTDSLLITPLEADIGQKVAISVVVVNTGGTAGTHRVTFKLDDTVLAYEDVNVPAGGRQSVTFSTTKAVAGTYHVIVDDLAGTLKVKEAPAPPRGATINWWLIGGLIAGMVAIATVVLLMARRREA